MTGGLNTRIMNQTTHENRNYKGMTITVRKHWSGSTDAFVYLAGEMYHFDTIKQAKSFINNVAGVEA